MSGRGKKHKAGKQRGGGGQPPKRKTALGVRFVEQARSWEIVHPRCARDRAEDIKEVEAMIEAGEIDVATDELRWLLSDCADFIDAHRLLGELAIEAEDWPLARGHLGYCYDIARAALAGGKANGPLSNEREANRGLLSATFLFAGVMCRLEKEKTARSVLQQLLTWDPNDPFGAAEALAELDRPQGQNTLSDGTTLVELLPPIWNARDKNNGKPDAAEE